ncbi:MAG: AbrB/MazE/SpoVT family DNA-binding domain-containing protein [Methanobrevibacter sp.]|jgi:AbrB family looped-hinge helix DNA binding protein|nr:AbrB/MazE/SpoVT family DNA-binding domain-containing protein [Candidatus Methanoflexus mossambicus]
MLTTKVDNKNQIFIPSEIRKRFNIISGDVVEWLIDEDKSIRLNFRKRSNLMDIVGIVSSEKFIDSVKFQKKIDKGEEIDNCKHKFLY